MCGNNKKSGGTGMTDREKAIIMAYTGTCMLTGEKFDIFHKYIDEICGRPIWTHELAIENVVDEIREKSKADFLWLCENSEQNLWFSVNEILPEEDERVLITVNGKRGYMVRSATYLGGNSKSFWSDTGEFWDLNKDEKNLIAWMPLPEPYEQEE